MQNYAIIENGTVSNIVVATQDFASEQGWILGETARIGDTWDGVSFVTPPQPKIDTELQWALVRSDRNGRLDGCDWTQLPDAPADAAVWAVYRQALRDITTQADPFAIVWPESPSQ